MSKGEWGSRGVGRELSIQAFLIMSSGPRAGGGAGMKSETKTKGEWRKGQGHDKGGKKQRTPNGFHLTQEAPDHRIPVDRKTTEQIRF